MDGSSGSMIRTPLPSTIRSKAIIAPRIGGSVAVPASAAMVTNALPVMLTWAAGTYTTPVNITTPWPVNRTALLDPGSWKIVTPLKGPLLGGVRLRLP
jgi:hypothetical protein